MTLKFGKQSEYAVMQYLRNQNFTIIAHSYKKFFGEIDIIAKKNNVIAFVEVKARKNSKVSLHDLITPSKQQKIIKVAQNFISKYPVTDGIIFRFDVALLHLQDNRETQITYIANAFCA